MKLSNIPEGRLLESILKGYPPPRGESQSLLTRRKEKDYWKSTTTQELSKLPIRLENSDFLDWLTGFWEGDGSVAYTYPLVTFAQKNPQVLLTIQEELEAGLLYPGIVHRDHFRLELRGNQALKLLPELASRLVCTSRITQINSLSKSLEIPTIVSPHLPTKQWFVGFWDAEGASGFQWDRSWISISQLDKSPLVAIQTFWGCGLIRLNKTTKVSTWSISSKQTSSFLKISELLLKSSRNPQKKEKLIKTLKVQVEDLIL